MNMRLFLARCIQGLVVFILAGSLMLSDVTADPGKTGYTPETNPRAIKNIKGMELVGSLAVYYATDVFILGDYAFLADDDKRLVSIDISNRENPQFLDSLGEYGSENGVAIDVSGDYAYVATEADGVLIADISDPSNLEIAGRFIYAYAKDVKVQGNFAYVADQDYGLRIVNINDASAPTEEGSIATDGPFSVIIAGDLAYCGDNDGGLCIINIVPPDNPTIVGTCHDWHSMRRIGMHNDYLYGDYDYSLDIINVADPMAPYSAGTYPLYSRAIDFDADYAYIATGYMGYGVTVLDLGEPAAPAMCDSIIVGYPTMGIATDENYVYVAAREMFLIYSKPIEYTCGDANYDEAVNVSDAVWIINYVFINGDPPNPLESGDANCDGLCNVSDAVWIINYVFIGGNDPCDMDGDHIPNC